jgi:hypothetical protein
VRNNRSMIALLLAGLSAALVVGSEAWAQNGCFTDSNGTRACPVGGYPSGLIGTDESV